MISTRFNSKLLFGVGIIISILLLILNGFAIKNKNERISSLLDDYSKLDNVLAHSSFNDSVNIVVQSRNFINSLLLETAKGEVVDLEDLVSDNFLILKFSKLSCDQCVENELLLFRELVDKIGTKKVAIITDYDDISQLYRFQRINKIEDVRILISKNDDLNLFPEYNYPLYYLVLDRSLNVKSFYIPDKGFNQLTSRYYRLIARHFFP